MGLALFMLWGLFAPVLSGQPLPTAAPDEVGLSATRLARIDSLMAGYLAQGKLPGVVTVIARRGRIVHFHPQGLSEVEAERPIQPETLFRIASMTKPITSVAIMMLYEEGRFQLEDPVSTYIPAFKHLKVLAHPTDRPEESALQPLEREITIRDLLTHTSGLSYGLSNAPIDSLYRRIWSPDHTLADMMDLLGTFPLAHQPGTRWRYSIATDVLGYLVEVLSGTPFDQFVRERIFTPLGMIDTDFYVPAEKIDRLATLYRVSESEGMSALDRLPPTRPPRAPSGGGGLFSTASDYVRFAQMLLNGGELGGVRLLGRKTVELMTRDHLPPGVGLPDVFVRTYRLQGYGFGLGFRVRTDVAASQFLGSEGEYGWAGAHETYFLIDPEEELIALYMTQLSPSGYYPLRRQFTVLVYQAIVE